MAAGHCHYLSACGSDLVDDSLRCASVSPIVYSNGVSALGGEACGCCTDASAGSYD